MAAVIAAFIQFAQPTHLLAVVALGLLVRSASPIIAFVLGLLTGSIAIAFAMRETPSTLVLLGIAAVAGMIAALARPLPILVASVLAFVTGVALALNSPPQAITTPEAIKEQITTGNAAVLLLAGSAWLAAKATRPWRRIGVRIAGSWIAASAILVLALRLAR
ncbi:MAG: hypothetical protein WCE79_16540 [Xanthobacteraceae bacterium]